MNVLNIYGEDGGEPLELPYLKKTGDTATGLIIFDAGIEVNNGTTAINGPAEFADTVLFKPSSTVVVDGSLQLTGDTFIVDCTTTEFNGATTEFNSDVVFSNTSTVNFGSGSAPNNTPVINTYRSQVNIGDGGQGSVNVDTAVNLGGFASLNLLNADINMEDDSIINQTGTRTIPNEMYSLNMTSGSRIQFPDNTQQNSAFTGAGALAGTYSPAEITLDVNGKITAISTASPPTTIDVLSVNVLNQPISYNPSNPVGHTNIQTGSDAFCSIANTYNFPSLYPTGINSSYVNDYVANKGVLISITPGVNTSQISSIKLRITFSFFGPATVTQTFQQYQNWGQTCCDMDMYPACWTGPLWTSVLNPVGQFYNIDNNIGPAPGVSSFNFVSLYAPNGRQYWTYNKSFNGIANTTGNYGYLVPLTTHQWLLLFTIPSATNTYSWSGKVEMLDASSIISLGGTVGLSSFNVIL
jgi:hypothetical protein